MCRIKSTKRTTTKRKEEKRQTQLENVAINDVLPLKAVQRCAIANVECFWGPGTSAT